MKTALTLMAALLLAVLFLLFQFNTSRPNRAARLAFSEAWAQEKNLSAPQFPSEDESESASSLLVGQLVSGGAQPAWVKNFRSGKLFSSEAASAMAVDAAGNVYVTGSGQDANGINDYLTIKYNAAGVLQWAARYNGDGNSYDEAKAMVVDHAGNVLVAGSSPGKTARDEYATIKYNANGARQWVARFGGPYSNGGANAIAVDQSDHIIVTGANGTVKYDRFGNEEWKAAAAGSRLFVDEADQIYVLGSVMTKYNALGEKIWSSAGGTGLALDDSGNVYVTRPFKFIFDRWSFDDYDYQTVKYDATGKQVWSARYDGPESNDSNKPSRLVVDQQGYVYVTGNSGTLKYNANGVPLWHLKQAASFVEIDDSGALFLAGAYRDSVYQLHYFLAQYDADTGKQQWFKSSTNWINAFGRDHAGNLYLTGGTGRGTSSDLATIKYDAKGAQQWAAYYDGPNRFSNDEGVALVTDDEGNVYVTGRSATTDTRADFLTLKYNAKGARQWMARYNGPQNEDDGPIAMALDKAGNVYVTGWSTGVGTGTDFATIKYNSEGVKQWVARYNSPQNWYDSPAGLAVDDWGNVYVAGNSSVSSERSTVSLIKYNAAGKQQWIKTYGTNDHVAALVVDHAGYVYTTGSTPSFYSDILTIKYNPAGERLWVAQYNGVGSRGLGSTTDRAHDLAVDNDGNVYVLGNRDSENLTIKYNAAGRLEWEVGYNDPARPRSHNYVSDLAVDPQGNVYVAGANAGTSADPDVSNHTLKYNAAGAQQWVAVYKTTKQNYHPPLNLTLDQAGEVYVTGFSSCSSNGSSDIVTIKYNADGAQQWLACYKGEMRSSPYTNQIVSAYAGDIAVDNAGNVYVSGSRGNEYGHANRTMTTIKYVQSKSNAKLTKSSPQPATYALEQNYPNPFRGGGASRFTGNASTTIRYSIAKPGHVTLQVFNLHGQEIATLVNENKSAGEYNIQWNPNNLPSGPYLYRLQAGEFIQTRKLVLLQ